MATNRGRVTVVNPWIPGGEGQLRDLFPLPPFLFILIRFIQWLFRHYLFTFALLIPAIYLWIARDWSWWQAFLLYPFLLLLLRIFSTSLYLWFRNPTIPLISRKPS